MHTWWTGLADAPSDEAQALHALGLGFMAARTLHVALEVRLFTHLAAGAQTLTQVAHALGLAERAAGRLWSGNLHASSPESCQRVLTRLRALLPPAGMVLIHDYLLDDTHTGPLIPALLALHLTMVSESTGRCIAGQNCAPCWRKPGSRRCV